MGAPNVTVVIEPSDGTSIFYEPVAPQGHERGEVGVDLPAAFDHQPREPVGAPEQGHALVRRASFRADGDDRRAVELVAA